MKNSAVLRTAAATQDAAVAHFAGRLSFEVDAADVAADLGAGVTGWVLIDSRSQESWDQGHLPGAIHLPHREITEQSARDVVPAGATVVTYCWGPGCNGATQAALAFARLGYPVKEMIGGFEYWVREGGPIETKDGIERRESDPLTAPRGVACAC